jgi:hypothetical protein
VWQPVVLHDGIISMATVDTAPAAAPHLSIARFHIDHMFFQQQALTACTGHRILHVVIALCLK